MPIITTNTGKKILKKAQSIWVLPYVYNSNIKDYVLGQNVYDISAIIGDSITIEQGDGETQTKNNEFTNEPLVKNVTSGEWKIGAQCLDLQNVVLKALFSAYTNGDKGIAVLRGDYDTMYALIRIRFSDTNTPDVYLPKVLMNSKLLLQQMKTRGSQGNINGTALYQKCAIIDTQATSGQNGSLVALSDTINGGVVYSPTTPILFVPKGYNLLIKHHRDEDDGRTIYDEISSNYSSTNQDCCAHDRVVLDGEEDKYTTL